MTTLQIIGTELSVLVVAWVVLVIVINRTNWFERWWE